MTGVELDPLTASISRGLYPHASIRTESFADTPITSNSFDLAVGNVPFSKNTLYDKTHNPDSRHSMHNHFILKSLAAVKPGGYVAVLTSSFNLDAANPASRREMSAMADLVGAVRLPTGAHRRAAGTEALTDLLLLRKREPGREPANTDWETVGPVIIAGRNVKINNYFDLNPQNVLGQITVGHGMYGEDTVWVKAEDLTAVPQLLARRLEVIVQDALEAGLGHTPAGRLRGRPPRRCCRPPGRNGTAPSPPARRHLHRGTGRGTGPFPVPKAHAAELRELLGLRDGARSLLEMEAADSEDTPELSARRTALAEKYTAYAATYGPLNRFTETVRTDKETGEDIITRRAAPAVRILRQTDPFGALPPALESFNEETRAATPAALLRHRQVVARKPLMGADTVDEALVIALDTYGAPELEKIAELLGVTEEEARDRLGTLVFDDPETGRLVTAPEYLSGNVRTKLDAARAAAAGDERWAVNVTALEEVQPPRVGMEDVEARLGAVWISPRSTSTSCRTFWPIRTRA
ncbi:protein involved in methylation (plasmid) [Arthrobacter sp. Hiyo8]|nr:protein involved in methylation [Arthrobacter sp. Hiyo8]